MIGVELKRIVGFLSLTLLVGCAAGSENLFWSEASDTEMRESQHQSESIAVSDEDTSSGPSYTTSQVSAAAGAALGAGIGAVVGSATGNAGGGLAIGAVAGAASGALVGNEFQKRDDVIANQREMLARQEEVIKAQGGNIEEIRRSLEDRFPTNKPSSSPRTLLDKYKGNPAAKPFAAAGEISPRARMDSTTLSAPVVTSSYNTTADSSFSYQKNGNSGLGDVAVKSKDAAPQKTAIIAQPKQIPTVVAAAAAPVVPAATIASASKKEEVEVATTLVKETKPAQPALGAVSPPAATPKAVAPEKKEGISTVAKMTTAETTGCKEAVDEARRAEEAVSEADKLFYYRRAARLCPVESSFRVKIGQVYATLGKKDQAKGEFEKALEIDPENVIANEELSLLESNVSN